jgi:hypothetical protein
VVLSHTPFRRLARETPLGALPVLVSGRGQTAQVAAEYGFKHMVTTEQLLRAIPEALPFASAAVAGESPEAQRNGGCRLGGGGAARLSTMRAPRGGLLCTRCSSGAALCALQRRAERSTRSDSSRSAWVARRQADARTACSVAAAFHNRWAAQAPHSIWLWQARCAGLS